MIKIIISTIIVLALIGGIFQFKSSDQSWELIIEKEAALNSVPNGTINIYKFFKELVSDSDVIEDSSLTIE